ncbi:WapI family immunity protein [Nonomuraea sp. H19]|uniref:WapI family immunity protein n=1 Tax=Nonomuraea sp. H19 TaxID=3452206 RepID=UPI003F8C1F1D
MEHAEIVIGRGGNFDHVLIRVLGRMHPGCTDFWDGNWLISPIHVQVGGFAAEVDAGLRIEELRDFRVALERVYAEVKGSATLSSLEHWIELTVEFRPTGALSIAGTVTDHPGMRNTLHFEIDNLDQTDIPELVGALVAVEKRFPVLGCE